MENKKQYNDLNEVEQWVIREHRSYKKAAKNALDSNNNDLFIYFSKQIEELSLRAFKGQYNHFL